MKRPRVKVKKVLFSTNEKIKETVKAGVVRRLTIKDNKPVFS